MNTFKIRTNRHRRKSAYHRISLTRVTANDTIHGSVDSCRVTQQILYEIRNRFLLQNAGGRRMNLQRWQIRSMVISLWTLWNHIFNWQRMEEYCMIFNALFMHTWLRQFACSCIFISINVFCLQKTQFCLLSFYKVYVCMWIHVYYTRICLH